MLVCDGFVFLTGAVGVVAMGLHAVGELGPDGVQIEYGSGVEHFAMTSYAQLQIVARGADDMGEFAYLLLREGGEHGLFVAGAVLDHGADFFGKKRRERIVDESIDFEVDAAAAGEGHFGDGGEESAVGPVVIGEDKAPAEQVLYGVVEMAQVAGVDIRDMIA